MSAANLSKDYMVVFGQNGKCAENIDDKPLLSYLKPHERSTYHNLA